MTIDENTGLPELPEGYFWRIKADSAGTRVHRMKRRLFLGPISTGSEYIFPEYSEGNVAKAIRKAAVGILRDLTNTEQIAPYTGDYLPKKPEK